MPVGRFPTGAGRRNLAARAYPSRSVSAYQLEPLEDGDQAIAVVGVAGELDLTNVADLEARLDALASPVATLVLDLNRVVFIDSAALQAFFRLARRRGRHGFGIVVEPGTPISRTLEIVDLAGAVTMGASIEEVRASLARPPG
jgi:anti-anti-sigma factor